VRLLLEEFRILLKSSLRIHNR